MRRPILLFIPVLLVGLAVGGCSSGGGGDTGATRPATDEPSLTPGEGEVATDEGEIGVDPTTAPTASEINLKIGTTKTFEGDGIKASVQVIAYRSGRFANYQVRVCNIRNDSGQEFSVTSSPWSIVYGTDEYSSELSYEGPKPEYPEGKVLANGQCAKGWLSFTLVGGKQPSGIDYQGGAGHFQWKNR